MDIIKTVKIFTGFVEQEQLAKDMDALRASLGGLRSVFRSRGIRLRTERCDSEDLDEIRAAMADSDVCVFLFLTELSGLTRAQFDNAYHRLADESDDNPAIFVWFREPEDAPLSAELESFRNELRQDIGHFINRYTDVDTVQFQLLLHLEREGAGVPFVWAGTKLLDARGRVVMDFAGTAAYAGDEMLQAVRTRLVEYEARQQALLERELDDELSDDELDELDEISDKIARATEEEAELQEHFLSVMRQFVSELAEDRQMSPRRRKAIQLITIGRVREGYELLDTREIERDTRMHETRAQTAAAEAQSERGWVLDGIKQLLLNVKMLLTFVEKEGAVKDEEIRHSYTVAIEFEERNGFEPLASVGYGEYLIGLGVYDKAVDLLDGACAWYRRAIERARDAQLGMYVAPDPYMPNLEGLRRGLAHALGLLVQGEVGADAASTAAYAASERIDILRDLFEPDDTTYGVVSYATDLISASRVMVSAQRPDDALEYLEQACDLLEEGAEDEERYDDLACLAEALETRRDLLAELGHTTEATVISRKLTEALSRMYHAYGSVSSASRLTKELRDQAHDAIGHGDEDTARARAQEALEIDRSRYNADPSTATAIALSKGCRTSSIIAARMHDTKTWITLNSQRLHALVVEYRRMPTVELQTEMGSVVSELLERWQARPRRNSAEGLLPELVATADALEGIAAPGEEIFLVGSITGDAIMGAVATMQVASNDPSKAEILLSARLDRLRSEASSPRGLRLYATTFERIANHLQEQGRIPFAYGMTSERLSALRLACGLETKGERTYASTPDDLVTYRVLVRALGYAAMYAREHGRPAEGNALLEERLGLLRESFSVTSGLNEAYTLNKALIEASEQRLARGNEAGMATALEEALHNARALHDAQASDATLRNLLYVGKRVDHRYREAGNVARAEEVLRTCRDSLMAYHEAHPEPEVAAYAAFVVWMYVVELRRAGTGESELAHETLAAYERMTGSLAALDAPAYLEYLGKHLNSMVYFAGDDDERRATIALSMSVAERAYHAREAAGTVELDDLRTLSSIYELGILVALERGLTDQAEEYIDRCVGLYEGRYQRALGQNGGEGAALSVEECASQLSKQLTRLASSMRRYGNTERADELEARSTSLLAEMHETNPRSRVSFVYSSQLHNDSIRLLKEGRVDEGIALRRKSTEVLDRYRKADPTERNLLWYTRSLMDLARVYRTNNLPEDADATERLAMDALRARYESDRSLMVLTRYLYTMSLIANRMQKTGEDDDQALQLYCECERLASEAFGRAPSVESARLLSLMQVYLYKQLHKMGRMDEARDLTPKEVETQRYLYERGRTQRGAKVFAATLYNEIRRLRFLARKLERQDYYQRSIELHNERVEVMRWLARRDTESAQRLVSELRQEITIIDPQDPWILKSMRSVHGVGHKYPPQVGAERALVCLEALMTLYRAEPSVDLEEQLCDMKGVRVQFLLAKHRIAKLGESEISDELLERMRAAANELYELVPMLEDRLARDPSEANVYRLAYYLKLASVVFEVTDSRDDALDALARRTELLKEQHVDNTGDATALVKYLHALKDQAELLNRMDRQHDALRLNDVRERACRDALANGSLDEHSRETLEAELLDCLKHRDSLFFTMGDAVLAERAANLETYIALLRTNRESQKVGRDPQEEASPQDSLEPDDDTTAPDETAEAPQAENNDSAQSWTLSLGVNLGRLAACRKDLGEVSAAIVAYNEAIRLLRELETDEAPESMQLRAGREIDHLVAERAMLLAEQFGTEAAATNAAAKRAMVVKAALDEALDRDANVAELSQEDALDRVRLHQLRYQLLRSQGDLEGALVDAKAAVTCLDAMDEETVDPTLQAGALAEWGKTLGECGRTDEAEFVRERKTETLRRAYLRNPTPELGLFLAVDLMQRVYAAEATGQHELAINLALERLELLCSLEPHDAEQGKRWRTQFKNASKKLVALAQTDEWQDAADDTLTRAERALAKRAAAPHRDHAAAGLHLDILAMGIQHQAQTAGFTERVEELAGYGKQVLSYAHARVLDPGTLGYHASHAAELFADAGLVEDADQMLATLRGILERQWKKSHEQAVGESLYQLYVHLLGTELDAAQRLELQRSELQLVQELRVRGLTEMGAKRIYQLYEQLAAYAKEAGSPLDAVAAGLALVERDYALAEQDNIMLEPLAESISQQLGELAGTLKQQRCGREASRLDYEARTCGKTLGKPGWNWWRQGYKSSGRPWRRESELGAAQKRLQRASHVMRLSLELGDWTHEQENHRNLRNLFQLRYEAYRHGQDAKEQIKSLVRLKWCLFNASTTLYHHRFEMEGLLAESIVLRIEMLEVLSDIIQLGAGSPKAREAQQEYLKALRTFSGQLKGDEYEGLGYADVRTWVSDRIAEAQNG